jgi:hypothetical protein
VFQVGKLYRFNSKNDWNLGEFKSGGVVLCVEVGLDDHGPDAELCRFLTSKGYALLHVFWLYSFEEV